LKEIEHPAIDEREERFGPNPRTSTMTASGTSDEISRALISGTCAERLEVWLWRHSSRNLPRNMRCMAQRSYAAVMMTPVARDRITR